MTNVNVNPLREEWEAANGLLGPLVAACETAEEAAIAARSALEHKKAELWPKKPPVDRDEIRARLKAAWETNGYLSGEDWRCGKANRVLDFLPEKLAVATKNEVWGRYYAWLEPSPERHAAEAQIEKVGEELRVRRIAAADAYREQHDALEAERVRRIREIASTVPESERHLVHSRPVKRDP